MLRTAVLFTLLACFIVACSASNDPAGVWELDVDTTLAWQADLFREAMAAKYPTISADQITTETARFRTTTEPEIRKAGKLEPRLILNTDMTARLTRGPKDKPMEGTWKSTSKNTGSVKLGGDTLIFQIFDGAIHARWYGISIDDAPETFEPQPRVIVDYAKSSIVFRRLRKFQ